jgi:hypothetical protein
MLQPNGLVSSVLFIDSALHDRKAKLVEGNEFKAEFQLVSTSLTQTSELRLPAKLGNLL